VPIAGAASPPSILERPAEPAAPSPPEPPPAEPEAKSEDGATAKTTAEVGTAIATVDIKRMVELWPAIVDHVRESGAEMLSTLFDGSRPIEIDSERSIVRIAFPSSAKFNKRKAEAQANVERIAESVKAIVGERLRPVYELVEGEADEAAEQEDAAPMAEEEIIELLKTKFDAREVPPDEAQEGAG
jgi:hypothetical protein